MATIQIVGQQCTVRLSEADDNREYRWAATCGAVSRGVCDMRSVGHLADAINSAIIHVDITCRLLKEDS